MASGHAYQRAFSTACKRWMQISSAYRKQKVQAGQIELDEPPLTNYHQYWNYAQRKGYSGTAIFTKEEPRSVQLGLGIPEHDTEGRVITLEFDAFYLVTVYTPNAQEELARIDYRMDWENAFRAHLQKLDAQKPVVFCGDLNVAHQEIDLKTQSPTVGRLAFQMKSGASSASCWLPASPIRFVIYTRI